MTDTPPEQPERTRFVDPPPAEAPPEPPGAETPVEEPLEEPVASAPVSLSKAPVERTQAEVPAEAAAEVPAEVPAEAVTEAPAEIPAEVPPEVPAEHPVASAPADLPDAPVERTQGRRRAATPLLAVLALLLAVGVGLLAWWAWPITHAGKPTFESTGADALKAAKADAKLVLAYDYRDLDKGFQKAVKLTTDVDGKDCPKLVDPQNKAYDTKATCFRSEFTRAHEKVVVDFAKRYQTVVLADVSAGGVERVDGDEVTVLLYVNQQSTNNLSSTPKITQARVEMTMKKVDGQWLVAGIRAL